jgi:hypothetical protein
MTTKTKAGTVQSSSDWVRDVIKLRVKFSFFDGKYDSEQAAELAAKAAKADPKRIESKIAALERKALRGISGPMSTMRRLWKSATRPWEDGGWRLCLASDYPKLREQLDDLQRKVRDGVKEVVRTKYDELHAEAKKALNGLLEDKFPSRERMLEKYEVQIFTDLLSPLEDTRVGMGGGMSQAEVDALLAERRAYYETMITDGNRDMVSDIASAVENLHETLSEADKSFHGSPGMGYPIFEAIESMLKRCERLNITKDEKVTALVAKVREALTGIDPEVIKEDKLARKDACKKAKSIMEELSTF